MIQALAITDLVLTEEQEQNLVRIVEDGAKSARKAQGLEENSKPGDQPKAYSWLWWRWMAELSFDNDFSWRPGLPPRGQITTGVEGMKIFTKSNQSANTPKDHARQLKSKIGSAVLKNNRFFGHKAEGLEDAGDPAIPAIQRRLRHRAKVSGFRDSMDTAIFKSLLSGEVVAIPSYKKTVKFKPVTARVVMDDKGFPVVSSATKSVVTEKDKWEAGADGRDYLIKDRAISKSTGSDPIYSKKPAKMLQPVVTKAGADFNLIHFMDLIVDPRWSSLDDADLIGNEFSWTFDELNAFLMNAGQTINENLDAYRNITKTGSAYLEYKARAKGSRGEDDDGASPGAGAGSQAKNDEMQPRIRMRQFFTKADILGLGARQNIWVIMDVELGIPLIYAHADDVVDVEPERGHPYRVIRAIETPDRWYGVPLHEDLWDDMNTIDSILNKIAVAVANSGNAVFVRTDMIKNYKDDKKILLNSDVPNVVEKTADPREVIHVEAIVPQIQELEASLNLALQRAQSKFGLSGAGQTVTDALPGTETATGQQILEESANMHVDAMIRELSKGIDVCVADFMKIELDNLDVADLINQLGDADAQAVIDWVESHRGDSYANSIEVVLAAITDTQTFAKNAQVMQLLQAWIQWPPPYQAVHKSVFVKALHDLDVNDPESLLITANEILAKEQALLAPAAAPTGVQPVAQPAAGDAAPPLE